MYEICLSMLRNGIPPNEIETTDIKFYMGIMSYIEKREREKEEAKLDKMGL